MTESTPKSESPVPADALMRLQRVLASAGIASRRQCEQIILEGRVDVDGKTVMELGTKVDPQRQKITVDGQQIRRRRQVYYMLNKPPGVLSTNHDESGRLRAIDLIDTSERIYTVGRLDKSSEGLIIVTNDGDLANQLTHPRYGVEKTYSVRVVGRPTPEHLDRLRAGIHLAEGFARVANVRIKKQLEHCSDLEIILNEGRNREIRRVLASLGHKVVSLKRIAIGKVRLGDLPRGAFREMTRSEVDAMRSSVNTAGLGRPTKRKPKRGSSWSKRPNFPARSLGKPSPRRPSPHKPPSRPTSRLGGRKETKAGRPARRGAFRGTGKPASGKSRSPTSGTNRVKNRRQAERS